MGRVLPLAPMAVPTLDEVASNPERATALPAGTLQGLLCRCLTVQTALMGALLAASGHTTEVTEDPTPDTLLDVTEAAKRLATTRDWLYRHAKQMPFTVRNGRQLRFNAAGIARYIREREGA
jgi:predicted DNA-binding transcriptional regulator AlpA